MRLSLIAALDKNGVIGRGDELPWRLSADLKLFKERTMGHPIILGRKTFRSIGRPLPGRLNIVLSRDPGFVAEGIRRALTWQEALEAAGEERVGEAYVIGGAEIYRLALPQVDRLILTFVEAEVEGDVTFPEIDWTEWQETEATSYPQDERNEHPFTVRVYDRKSRSTPSQSPAAESARSG